MINVLRQRLHYAQPAHLWLLAGLALAFLPHITRLPFLLTLFSLFLVAWRFGFELRLFPLPKKIVRWLLTLLALAITFASFHTLFGRQAGVALLIVMLCLKLLEMTSSRDVAVVIGLGYFEVITVFLFDQSIIIGIYMLLAVTLLTTALTAFSRSSSQIPQWLNLRAAGTILLQAAPITLLLFILFPRIPGPLWSLPADAAGAGTGLSDSMSPGKISQLSNNNAVAFRVQFDGEVPTPDKLYWRGPIFSDYDGQTWRGRTTTSQARSDAMSLDMQPQGDAVSYVVTLEPHQQQWLFALELVDGLPANSLLTADYELVARQRVRQLTQYRVTSFPQYTLGTDASPDIARYLQLPANSSPQARNLAMEFRQYNRPKQEVVTKVLEYFREQPFFYTRTPPLLGDNPVDDFLFNTRRGFCEHYASAFVFLMRAAGIPARVVTGYQGGEANPLGNYFIVRQSDAHAWAEVWLNHRGWLRIDPTAVIPPSRIENQSDLQRIAPETLATAAAPGWTVRLWRNLGYGLDNLNHFWNQWIIGYNDRAQNKLLSKLGMGDIDWRGMVSMMVAGIILVMVLIALKLLKTHHQQQDPASEYYQQFCRKLRRRGLVRQPAETASDFAARARSQASDLGPGIYLITQLYQRSRYAPRPTPETLQRLQTAVRTFRT